MVTKNPKISVYVPDDLKVKLLEKKEELRSNSVSAVVVTILEEYFGIAPPQSNAVSNAWVEQVNVRLAELEAEVSKLSDKTQQPNELTSQKNDTGIFQLQFKETITQSNAIVTQHDSKTIERQNNTEITQSDVNIETDENTLILSTSQVTELTGIKRKRLAYRRDNNRMPIDHEGWRVISFQGKDFIEGKHVDTWAVTKL